MEDITEAYYDPVDMTSFTSRCDLLTFGRDFVIALNFT